MANLHFIWGGARSGKSAFASRLAAQVEGSCYFGAADAGVDALLQNKIDELRVLRGEQCKTVESKEGVESWLQQCAERQTRLAFFDCATLWIAGLVTRDFKKYSHGQLMSHLEKEVCYLIKSFQKLECDVVVLATDVSSGVVPNHPSARVFRDVTSSFCLQLGQECLTLLQMICGQPILLKSPTPAMSLTTTSLELYRALLAST